MKRLIILGILIFTYVNILYPQAMSRGNGATYLTVAGDSVKTATQAKFTNNTVYVGTVYLNVSSAGTISILGVTDFTSTGVATVGGLYSTGWIQAPLQTLNIGTITATATVGALNLSISSSGTVPTLGSTDFNASNAATVSRLSVTNGTGLNTLIVTGAMTAVSGNFSGELVVGTSTPTTLNTGVATIGSGTTILKVSAASTVHDCGSIIAGAEETFTVSCSGAVAGNPVSIGVSVATENGLIITAECTTNGSVTIKVSNHNLITAVDPASRTYKVMVVNF